jgi:hypothetical protein
MPTTLSPYGEEPCCNLSEQLHGRHQQPQTRCGPAFDARNCGFKKLSELVRSLKYLEVKELPMARPDGVTIVHVQIRLKPVGQSFGLRQAI